MNKTENISFLPENNEDNLDLTKQCKKVIKCLYKRRLNNKELAHSLGVSASALSNSLQKIRNINSNLLVIEQIGRNTFYSLSECGLAYVETNLINNKIINNEDKISEYTETGIFRLNRMKKEWGEDWDLKFEEMLLFYTHSEIDKIENIFMEFIHVVERLFLEEQWEELNTIYDLLDANLLRKRIDKYFDRIMGVKSLCNIDDFDWKTAYEIVDNFFENGGRTYYKNICEKIENHQLSCENIDLIFASLNEILVETTKEHMEKETFYDKWKNVFMSHERLMYYVAEKYIARN